MLLWFVACAGNKVGADNAETIHYAQLLSTSGSGAVVQIRRVQPAWKPDDANPVRPSNTDLAPTPDWISINKPELQQYVLRFSRGDFFGYKQKTDEAGANPEITALWHYPIMMPPETSGKTANPARITYLAADGSGGELEFEEGASSVMTTKRTIAFSIEKPELKEVVKSGFEIGDRVNFSMLDGQLTAISLYARKPVGMAQSPLVYLLGAGAVIFLIACGASSVGHYSLITGEDNRVSNSKFQIAIWSWALLSSYVAVLIQRFIVTSWEFIGGINIPQNLLLLSGLSGVTFVAAKGIVTNQISRGDIPTTNPRKASLRDLFTDNSGRVDFGDFQMVIVTVIAALTFVLQVYKFMVNVEFSTYVALPDVDSTILSFFGLGQGAYLLKKAVTNDTNANINTKINTKGQTNNGANVEANTIILKLGTDLDAQSVQDAGNSNSYSVTIGDNATTFGNAFYDAATGLATLSQLNPALNRGDLVTVAWTLNGVTNTATLTAA